MSADLEYSAPKKAVDELPDEDDAARLVAALWRQVLADLAHGRPAARAWLDSPQFDYWARLSLPSVAPAEVRARLLECWEGRTAQAS